MKGGAKSMEQMKVSSIVKCYPNSFVLAQKVKVNASGTVELANVMSVCATKQDAYVQQAIFKMVGVKTFLIPTIESDDAVQITLVGDKCTSEPLLTPADHARVFRQYYLDEC